MALFGNWLKTVCDEPQKFTDPGIQIEHVVSDYFWLWVLMSIGVGRPVCCWDLASRPSGEMTLQRLLSFDVFVCKDVVR